MVFMVFTLPQKLFQVNQKLSEPEGKCWCSYPNLGTMFGGHGSIVHGVCQPFGPKLVEQLHGGVPKKVVGSPPPPPRQTGEKARELNEDAG
jgi:hypothetical protein